MKAKVSYSKCSIYVEGMDLNCPMCGVKVLSGNQHACGLDVQAAAAAEAAKPKEGWALLNGAKKWHYFCRDGRSICGRYMTFKSTDFEQGDFESSDNCASCFARRQRSVAKQAKKEVA